MKYQVDVDYIGANTKIVWTYNGEKHCEHGPAVWWQDGTYDFYLNGVSLSISEWEEAVDRQWNPQTKRSSRREFPKVYLVTKVTSNGASEPVATFDSLAKVDEFILKNETDEIWFNWVQVELR
jgi:hypothetical protein